MVVAKLSEGSEYDGAFVQEQIKHTFEPSHPCYEKTLEMVSWYPWKSSLKVIESSAMPGTLVHTSGTPYRLH